MADDVARLGLEVDSSSVKTGAENLQVLQSVATRTGQTIQQVQQNIQRATQQTTQTTQLGTVATRAGTVATQAGTVATQAANAVVSIATQRAQQHALAVQQATISSQALNAITNTVSRQFIAMAAGFGPVGVFLAGLGPLGLAAAVGLYAVQKALEFVNEEATRMGQKAVELRSFSVATGLNVEQIGRLKVAFSQFGISGDEVETRIERFTFQLNAAQQGGGQLFETVRQIDVELAKQLQQSTSTAQGLEILGRAYQTASDAQTKALLGRQSFGRGGEGAIAGLGGISLTDVKSTTAAMDELGVKSDAQIQKWAQMSAEIQKMERQARNVIASIFTEETLALQLKSAQAMLDFAKAVRDAANAAKELGPLQTLWERLKQGPFVSAEQDIANLQAAARRVRGAQGQGQDFAPPGQELDKDMSRVWRQYIDEVLRGGKVSEETAKSFKQLRDNAMAANTAAKERLELLGPAATIEEQYAEKFSKLNASFLTLKGSSEDLERAVNALNRELGLKELEDRIQLLGNAATVTEQYALKERKLANELANATEAGDKERAAAARRGIGQLGLDKELELRHSNISALGDAATAQEKYNLEVDDLNQKFREGKVTVENYDRAVQNLEPTFSKLRDSAGQFLTGLTTGLMQGKSLSDSLKSSLENVAQSAASNAITSLLKQDYASAAVSGGIAIGSFIASKFFGKKDDAAQQAAMAAAEQARQEAIRKIQAQATLNSESAYRMAVARLDTSTVAGAIEQKRLQDQKEINSALADGLDTTQLMLAQAAEITRMAQDAEKNARAALAEPLSPVQRAMQDITKNAADLAAALTALGKSSAEASQLAVLAMQRLRDSFEKDIAAKINEAQGKGYFNTISDLMDSVKQMRADAAALGLSPDQVNQYFQLQAQKIVDEANLTGDAFAELIQKFPELSGVVHEATKNLQALGQTIRDYLTSLKFGNLSTLSPLEQLKAAQAAFDALLQKAQQGDQDALGKVTKAADILLTTARAYYGPSAQYGAVYSATTGALGALPGVPGGRLGGRIGFYGGGLVGGGTYDVDSVMARMAGGGSVMLAGGEYVTRAPSVNAQTLPMLDQINRTGRGGFDSQLLVDHFRGFQEALMKMIQQLIAGNQIYYQNLQETKSLRSDIRQSAGEKNLRAAVKR